MQGAGSLCNRLHSSYLHEILTGHLEAFLELASTAVLDEVAFQS